MYQVICNTSPIQYLHQVGLLHILPALADQMLVPPAVVDEISVGRSLGIDLPDLTQFEWVHIRTPISQPALPLITDLGPGESEVLMLALEIKDTVVILDDSLARWVAVLLDIRVTGSLGLLIDAKKAKLIKSVRPVLDQLQLLRFRISPATRAAILNLAGES